MALSPFKFNRNYTLQIDVNANAIGPVNFSPLPLFFTLPISLEFDVTRKDYSSAGTGTFTLYNLSEKHRRMIAHDEWDQQNIQAITLRAGYGDGPIFPTIFKGNVTKCYSERRGVDFVTVIEAWDGADAMNSATFDQAFPPATPLDIVITAMCASLSQYNIAIGAIGTFEANSSLLGNAYSGDTISLLNDITGFSTFIENQTINCLQDTEHLIIPDIPLINTQSGLLGTPIRQQSFIQFDVIFEPRAKMGALIMLESTTATATGFSGLPNYNGFYKISNLHHRGTISPVKCGDLITTIGIPAFNSNSTGIVPVTPIL